MSIYDNTKLLPLRTYRQMRAQRDRSPELGPHEGAILFKEDLITGYPARRVTVGLASPPEAPRRRGDGELLRVVFHDFATTDWVPVAEGTMHNGIWTPEEELVLWDTPAPALKQLFVLPGQQQQKIIYVIDLTREQAATLGQPPGGSQWPFDGITPP